MAKKTSSADPSLPLHEVLEAEFTALYGELPADYSKPTEPAARLKAIWSAIHGLKEKRSALCISGGGIRSATFGLGVLQGLARSGLLDKFHYLSTVSGGGYIGGWLSAWIKNDPQGVRGVVTELKRRPDSALNPESAPIRHLREFSNYLAPRTGLTSVDFWTLIATFIRNMFLNWLVLISCLAAAMMIPRLYLAAINLQPDWSGLATLHSWHLLANNLPPDWNAWEDSVKWPWDIGLTILLAVGFALIAVAMAYAIIDVPSTGNARLSQRRFLIFRQLPLFLASLILAAWWAVFCNVHGDEPFRAGDWRVKFVAFYVSTYVCGGLLGTVLLSFRNKRAPRGRFMASLWRLGTIVVTAAFAGFCLWAMATRLFLDPKEIEFTSECEAIQIPSGNQTTILQGTKGVIKQIVWGSDTIGTLGTDQVVFRAPPWVNLGLGDITLGIDEVVVRIAEKDLDAFELNPIPGPETNLKFTFTRDCEAILIPSGQKTKILQGTEGEIMETVERSYTVKTGQGLARIATKDLNALKLRQAKFTLVRDCDAIEIPSGQKTKILQGTEGQIKKTDGESYTVETDSGLASIAKKDLDAFEMNPVPDPKTNLPKFTLKRDCEAIQIPSGEKTRILQGTKGLILKTDEESYTVETDPVLASIAKKDLDAFEMNPVPAPAKDAVNYVCFAPALIMAVVMLVNFLFTGLTSWVTQDEDREWWGRSAAWILITIVGWILVNLVVLWGGQAISPTGNQLAVFLGQVQANPVAKALLGAFGGVTGIAAALLALRSKLSSKLGQKGGSQWLLVVVALVFFVLLAVVISWALLLIGSQHWLQNPNDWQAQLFVVAFLTGATLLFGIAMGFLINANKFSLHATYRNRLIRAYLAASRSTEARKPSLFTGFDPEDNFELHKLSSEKPLHVINGALNLVRGQQLAWQERKAESFTMSRLHCGCLHIGYRPSPEYGDGITMGTAVAISGAAANPNMGYHSSPVVGFLMALFNVRLGWWLGNPGSPGAKTWRRSGPGYSVGPLFSEAIGNTTDRYKYVNVSDGGHFENLGLYEMVLRRCHYIVVSDAGEDPECSFADLGEAVRKIRIDFGIPIEFGPMSIYPRSQIDALKGPGHNCAIGRIRYSVVDGSAAPDGVIVYIKPACYGDEPRDIYEYFKTSKTFPHESTANQFFSESQFESYRMLGAHTMEKLCTDCGGDFRCFIREILKRHLEMEAPDWLAKLLDAPENENKV